MGRPLTKCRISLRELLPINVRTLMAENSPTRTFEKFAPRCRQSCTCFAAFFIARRHPNLESSAGRPVEKSIAAKHFPIGWPSASRRRFRALFRPPFHANGRRQRSAGVSRSKPPASNASAPAGSLMLICLIISLLNNQSELQNNTP